MAKRKAPKRYRLVCTGTFWYGKSCHACGEAQEYGKRSWAVLQSRNGQPIADPKFSRYAKGAICDDCVDIVAEVVGADIEELDSGKKK